MNPVVVYIDMVGFPSPTTKLFKGIFDSVETAKSKMTRFGFKKSDWVHQDLDSADHNYERWHNKHPAIKETGKGGKAIMIQIELNAMAKSVTNKEFMANMEKYRKEK